MKAVASAVLAAVAVVACEKIPLPVETAKAPIGVGPNAEIVDGSHGGGNAHFFFLPPLVPAPSFSGVFDASLLPVVRICRWTGTACATPPLAEFTTATGSGSEVVRVDPDAEQYIVNWHTGRFALDPALDYRIAVLVDGTELGHADVDVVASGRELRGVDRSRFVAVLNGQTLPIKFRIEQGALPPPGPFLQVDPGGLHTCGIRASGAAYCWGYNGNAQLGFGWLGSGSAVEMSSPTPVAVLGGLTFTHVSVGLSHACALTADGTVYCWGSNLQGQLGTGSGSYSTSPALVTGGHTFTMVDAGAAHT